MAKDKKNKPLIVEMQGNDNPQRYHFFKRWMTLPEAAWYSSQSEATLKKAVYRGALPVIQRGARSKMIFDVVDLDAWLLADKGVHKGPVDERQRAKNGRFK
jgi:hypothetical protein